MPNFRRYYVPNAVVFITAVTNNRIPYLRAEADLALFWQTLRFVQEIHPFNLLAHVTLDQHFHWLLWVRDPNGDFSTVLHSLKRNFTINFKRAHGIASSFQLWQDRFWDHVIRNTRDLERHFDYIHYNPVKHGYVKRPEDWAQSTYTHWLERGYYEPGWGHEEEPESIAGLEYE
jgi:putative transposase